MSKIPFFKIIPVLLVLVFFLLPSKTATAQEIVPDTVTFIKAEVVEILEEKLTVNPVTGSEGHYQSLNTRMLEGERKGEMIVLENRYPFLKVGEKFYARHTFNRLDGIDWWVVAEPYRIPAVFFFIALFLVTLCVFGGKQGLRGLLSLSASLLFIWYVLLPSVVAGQSPILVSIIVASFIVFYGFMALVLIGVLFTIYLNVSITLK